MGFRPWSLKKSLGHFSKLPIAVNGVGQHEFLGAPFELGIIGEIVGGIAEPCEHPMRPVRGHAASALEHFVLTDGFGVGLLFAQEENVVGVGRGRAFSGWPA